MNGQDEEIDLETQENDQGSEDGGSLYPELGGDEGGAGGAASGQGGGVHSAPPAPGLGKEEIGEIIAGAIAGASGQNQAALEALANRVLGQLGPKEQQPTLTKEERAARNAAIFAKLTDVTGEVDIVEEITKLVAPAFRSTLEGEFQKLGPVATASLSNLGASMAREFKAEAFADMPAELKKKANEEFGKLVKPENHAWLAGLNDGQREEFLTGIKQRVKGILYEEGMSARVTRNVSGGSSPGGSGASPGKTAFLSLHPKQQLEIHNEAERFARVHGLSPTEDKKKYDKYIADYIDTRVLGV